MAVASEERWAVNVLIVSQDDVHMSSIHPRPDTHGT